MQSAWVSGVFRRSSAHALFSVNLILGVSGVSTKDPASNLRNVTTRLVGDFITFTASGRLHKGAKFQRAAEETATNACAMAPFAATTFNARRDRGGRQPGPSAVRRVAPTVATYVHTVARVGAALSERRPR